MSLPTGYTEVQYIQSSGTQYVDTEFIPNANTRIFMDVENPSHPSNGSYFGARSVVSSTDPNANVLVIMSSSGLRSDYYGDDVSTETYPTGRHTIDKNKNVVTIGDANIVNAGSSTGVSTYTLFIFGTNTAGAFSLAGYLKLYSCQIYDNGSLIRNFIPCINPDGEAGLYDTVNSKFYGNAGTGVFFAGPPKVSLPSGYKQLEYIQSIGTQYVDTEIVPNDNTRVIMDFQLLSAGRTNQCLFGVVGQFSFRWYGSSSVFRSNGSNSVNFPASVLAASRHVVDKTSTKTIIDQDTSVETTIGTCTLTLYLMAQHASTAASNYSNANVFSCQIYDNATLIRDFIPCSNPSGAIGLYDLVNSKFYANAGTGVFTAGPEVAWPSNDAIYVKVNGIWRQIDGIKLL